MKAKNKRDPIGCYARISARVAVNDEQDVHRAVSYRDTYPVIGTILT